MVLGRLLSLLRVGRRDPHLASLAVRVYVLLVLARAAISLVPLRRITRLLGAPMAETASGELDPAESRYARRVGWCIEKLSPHTPTESNCYPQALTARVLLHRKGIPSTIYYGAAFEPGRPALATHAWRRCGSLIVTGGRTGRRFEPLTYFADAVEPRNGLLRARRESSTGVTRPSRSS
jgi:hypothetical protein